MTKILPMTGEIIIKARFHSLILHVAGEICTAGKCVFILHLLLHNALELKAGIFARRAMVDQARRASATREKLNILVYLT